MTFKLLLVAVLLAQAIVYCSADGDEINPLSFLFGFIKNIISLCGSRLTPASAKLIETVTDLQNSILEASTSSPSPIILAGAVQLMGATALLASAVTLMPNHLLSNLADTLPPITIILISIITELSPIIGQLSLVVNQAISDVLIEVEVLIAETLEIGLLSKGVADRLCLKRISRALQKLAKTVSRIAAGACSTPSTSTGAISEATTVVSMVLNYILLYVQSIVALIEGGLSVTLQTVPQPLKTLLCSLNIATHDLTASISLVVCASAGVLVELVKALTSTLLSLTNVLVNALSSVVGAADDVIISVGDVTRKLTQSVFGKGCISK